MRPAIRRSILLSLPMLVCGAASPALAQDGAKKGASDGDIIVTARRVEERLQDVPISITVFNQQGLANRNITAAGDLAQYTPSLSSNSRFGAENTSFAIRGFVQDGGTAPSVGVFFADVVALRASAQTTVGNGAGIGQFFDLANVQVLKGPQGTLFGRNTSGGDVLLVPQKPTDKFEGYIEGSVGNYNMRRIQAVVNVPLTDSLRIRLGVDRQTRDGFEKNHSGIGPGDFNDIDYTAVRASVLADLTPTLQNYFVGTYSNSSTSGVLPHVFDCSTAATNNATLGCIQADRQRARGDGPYDVENSIINPYQKIRQWQLINNTSWEVSDNLTIKNIISYGEFVEKLRSDVYGSNFIVPVGGVPVTGGVPASFGGVQYGAVQVSPSPSSSSGANSAQSTFTEELQLQGQSFGDKLKWQAGLYMEDSEPIGYSGQFQSASSLCFDDNSGHCTTIPNARSGTSNRLTRVRYLDYAAYAQGTYRFSPHWSVTAGLRYTEDLTRAQWKGLTYAVQPVLNPTTALGSCFDPILMPGGPGRTLDQCVAQQSQKSQGVTGLFDIDWKPNDKLLIYAKYSRGYRQGGVSTTSPGIYQFSPERINSYEVGFKANFLDPVRGHLNVAGFYNDLANQQIALGTTLCGIQGNIACAGGGTNPLASPTVGIANAGKSRIGGVEVDGGVTPFEGLTLDFSYTYLDTKLKSFTSPAAPTQVFASFFLTGGLVGQPLALSPKNKGSVTVSYTLPVDASMGTISIGGTFTHTDAMEAVYSDYSAAIRNVVKYNNGQDLGRLPATDLLNLNLNWRSMMSSQLDLSLFMTNVTNVKYPAFIIGGISSFGFEGAIPGEPRMYGMRLKYHFGS